MRQAHGTGGRRGTRFESRPGTLGGHRRGVARLASLVALAGLAATAAGQQLNLPGEPARQPGAPLAPSAIPTSPSATPSRQPSVTVPPAGGREGIYTIPAFTEPAELTEIVDYIVNALQINVIVDPDLSGEVVINRPIELRRDQMITFLNDLLEQRNYMIYQEPSGWYQIVPATGEATVPSEMTTRMIATPNMKPSSLRPLVESVFPPSRAQAARVVYLDDVGLIAVTDTPRTVAAVERIIDQVREQLLQVQFFEIPLRNISAPAARDRAIELLGGAASGGTQPNQQNQFPQFQNPGAQAQPQTGNRTAGLITNIEARLMVNAQGNALIFSGRQEELNLVRQVIDRIDVASQLESRSYDAGQYAEQIANLARGQGLGEVVVIEEEAQNQNQFGGFVFPGQQRQAQATDTLARGSRMIVDVRRGKIIYFGTTQQHEILARLIDEIGLESEAVTIRAYALQNADAEETADLLRQLILGQAAGGEGGSLLPTGGGQQQQPFNPFLGFQQQGGPEQGVSLFGDEYTQIVADIANNQILVRAPANLQPQYEKLINDLDMRRQQVYIRAHIVAVSNTESSRLAFETQIINAAGDPVLQTNFGLNQGSTDILEPRQPLANLTGLTTAVIQSKYVPIIMHATATDTDSRIVSSPQLLVNDNFEASIQAIDQQPTTSTSQTTGAPSVTAFNGYEDAGTTLTVTPSISSNGWIRMQYEITLSNFTGVSTTDGVPPPKQDRTVTAEAVTIPSDATIVVGGIVVEDTRNTVVKIPIIGDIPLIGHLFRDTNKNDTSAILYVFITPYIMSDPSFQDMRLLTRGPQSEVDFPDGLPQIQPRMIDIISPAPAPRLEP
ncbi:MAG: secretin N-terminal domain-containing protein [Phycisphaerales bacterium]